MSNAPARTGRNQAMELAKLAASAFVVFIHVHFPGRAGELVDYMGSFAVPMFFMITGYFNYQATDAQVRRRLGHILRLYLLGMGAYLLWQAVWIAAQGGTAMDYIYRVLPDHRGLTMWAALQEEFLAGHLWYVHALVVVYGAYWAYLRFFGGRQAPGGPLYAAGFMLLSVTLTVGVIVPLHVEDFPGVCRNAWLMGMPMFCLGMFLREYQQALLDRLELSDAKLTLVVALGAALTLQQWFRFSHALPFGTLLAAPALLLLLAKHPRVCAPGSVWERAALRCGACSTWIYLFHLIVDEAYGAFFQQGLAATLGSAEGWLRPVLVFAVSAALAVLIELGARAGNKQRR